MKRLHSLLSFILALSLLFTGCSMALEDETASMSGDLAYYAEMNLENLEKDCKGKYIEVSGNVSIIYQYTGQLYLGSYFDDNIQISCRFTDKDSIEAIEKGDYITVKGKLQSCISSSVYLEKCTIQKSTDTSTTEATLDATTADTPLDTTATTSPALITTTESIHIHSFSEATCIAPRSCSCGATEGSVSEHQWQSATCSTPQTCTICSATSGTATGHSYSNGKCTTCGQADPNYVQEEMVWIPTKGGTKYHSYSGCSNMEDPEYVTKSEAISRGFTACKRCH